MTAAPARRRWLVWAAALFSAAVGLCAQWPGLASPFVVNDDVRQQLFWMQRWLDPALYPPDLLNEYARLYVSWGVRGLYRLGCLIWEPLFFGKLVAVGLFAWLGGLLFRTGEALRDRTLGLVTLGVYWLTPAFMENISGGLARAFAAPLLALFVLALASRSRGMALLALLGQALFIPYILLVSLGTAAAHFLLWRMGVFTSEPLLRRPADALVAALALALAVGWQSGLASAGYGPLPWAGDVANDPVFAKGGRLELQPQPSILWELVAKPWGTFAPFRDLGTPAGTAATALLLPLLALGARRTDWRPLRAHAAPMACLLLASLALYTAARLLLFKLFVPGRYLEYTTNLAYCLGLALLIDAAIRPRLARMPRAAGAALLGAALLAGAARQYGQELFDYSDGATLYAFARTTPPASRFAGLPQDMDNLLTFGQRNVYVSFELAHPWSAGLWRKLKPRLERIAHVYYSSDPDEVRRFCLEEGVDFLVVDRRRFGHEFMAARAMFEPFGALVRERAQNPAPFALLSDDFKGLALSEHVTVYDMRRDSANQKRSTPEATPAAQWRK